MSKRKIRISILIIIPCLLVGGFLVNKYLLNQSDIPTESPTLAVRSGAGKMIPVTVALVQSEQIIDGIRAMGSLIPNEEVDIAGEIAGKVTSINFEEGASVSKGQLLVKINDDDLQAQLNRYEFQEQNLRKKLERQRILFEKEAISGEMFDQVQTEYNVLLADVEILKVKIERCRIKAPFSGTIGFRTVSDGSYIQVGSKIARLVDFNTLKLEFSIPEKYINKPLVGTTIYFSTESDPSRKSAKIYAMEPKLESNTRTIILRALYNNTAGKLRPGMSLRVTIPTSELSSSLMIPTEAVVPAMDSKSVWMVKDGKPVMVLIETGTRLENKIEVIKGLSEGDSVIITGLMQIREGAAIKVTN